MLAIAEVADPRTLVGVIRELIRDAVGTNSAGDALECVFRIQDWANAVVEAGETVTISVVLKSCLLALTVGSNGWGVTIQMGANYVPLESMPQYRGFGESEGLTTAQMVTLLKKVATS
jgi:hypothetical protein